MRFSILVSENPPFTVLVTWVVVEVERVSAVALNMLVSTSFPAELLLIGDTERSSVVGPVPVPGLVVLS